VRLVKWGNPYNAGSCKKALELNLLVSIAKRVLKAAFMGRCKENLSHKTGDRQYCEKGFGNKKV
jgi:hypothetical protein